MSNIVGFPTRPRGTDLPEFEALVAREVKDSLALLRRSGLDLFDVEARLNCSRRSLLRWQEGVSDMPAKKLLALRALVAERAPRRAA